MNHHAYYVESDIPDSNALTESLQTVLVFPESAAIYTRHYEKFGIDESRELTTFANLRSISRRSLFTLHAESMTTEAQQALLKLFEEPPEGIVFVLIVPHGILIPTLRSRMLPLPLHAHSKAPALTSTTKAFLHAAPKERSEMIGALLKKADSRKEVRTLVCDLEAFFYGAKDAKTRIEALSEISSLRPYLTDRSPSLKMILEHISSTVPQL